MLTVAVWLMSLMAVGSVTAQQSGATDGFSALWHSDTLTGDWDGERTWLADEGVTFSMTYTGDLQANTRGGIKQGAVYDSLLQPQVDLDLEKLIGWKGLTARISAVALSGPSLSSGYVGNLANVSSINGRPAIRLYNAWLQQKLAGDAVSIRVGLMNVDAEFFVSSTASLFVNSTFGWAAILARSICRVAGPPIRCPHPGCG